MICSHCFSERAVKNGISGGHQRYFCNDCKRGNGGKRYTHKVICYHCGGADVKRHGVSKGSGFLAFCLNCLKWFLQGGKWDLEHYHLVLKQRIAETNHSEEIKEELFQMASQDVLEGKGYCWNIPLRVRDAIREAWGEYNQAGSSHPIFREQ